ncbi:LexA family protein [Streptomyces olivaceoviridis]|uniref:LexA family protein n=1 Tax=Streptomyces olivaceoviridis TaxID=1921 RepID=UPI003700C03F
MLYRTMHRVDYLTGTQERIVRRIRQRIAGHGRAPAVRQIGAAVGMSSRASVHCRPGELGAKGAIVREPGRS